MAMMIGPSSPSASSEVRIGEANPAAKWAGRGRSRGPPPRAWAAACPTGGCELEPNIREKREVRESA